MKQAFALPHRQIHLDFHTSPSIPDVGVNFDAREFARTMKRAHVASVTVFAKCHHGHLYYNTRHPARHPGLRKSLDLLRRQVDALHAQQIRAPIYISVQCDEYAANTHPDWIARNPDGTNVGAKPLQDPYPAFTWQILDMSSPYRSYLLEQTREVLKLFRPVDGVFFDMCWDQPSTSSWALAGMLARGLDPQSPADRSRYAHGVAIDYMRELYRLVKGSSPGASVYFNSRPLHNLAQETPMLTQVEIEALPTGFWGYMYFPKNVRFVRTFDQPYIGITARFHRSWADFGGLKPYAALEYETSQMMAHAARCSIGDQLHPRGTLDPAAYELIGSAYARVARREPWLVDAKALVQIGLFRTGCREYHGAAATDDGATRMLMQLKHQFNVIDASSDFDPYELLILPDEIAVDEPLAAKLRRFVKAGGALLFSGASGFSAELSRSVLREIGVAPLGKSPFLTTYLRIGREIARGVPDTDHVMYEQGIRVRVSRGTRVLARVVEPYFNRTWQHFSSHCHAPPASTSAFPAATINRSVAYISYPVFAAFAKHGNYPYRLLVGNIIDLLLPDRLLQVDGPTSMEASVTRQRLASGMRTIVHLLQYCPERRAEGLDLVEDIVPVHDVAVSLRLQKRPRRVYLAPEMRELPADYSNGRARLIVPRVCGHAMIVFE